MAAKWHLIISYVFLSTYKVLIYHHNGNKKNYTIHYKISKHIREKIEREMTFV